tara:strand:- start:13035 stop:14069 length:1035 start_codon:yes stop_codon:yes gene_type:complete
MINIINLIIFSTLFAYLNYLCFKYKFFIDNHDNSNHKKFILQAKPVPTTGGMYLFFGYVLSQTYIYNFSEIFYFGSILVVGCLSDIYKNFYPSLRLLFQVVICLLFLAYFNLNISDVRVEYVNILFSSHIISFIFTAFCLVVLINGSNFIDGVNLLSVGYYLSILISLIFLSNNYSLLLNQELVIMLAALLAVLIFFNGFNKVFLGDGGIYFLSFIIAIILIKFDSENSIVSPYYIISLLWYPCFENLFSILRKKLSKINPQKSDNMHLHHLIYRMLKSQKSKIARSNLAGLIILLFNFPVFVLSSYYFNFTKYLLIIILVCVASYIFSYFLLTKILKKRANNS